MKEALKLALELKNSASAYWTEKEISIIEKLIDALAQPEQEPVAWVCYGAPGKQDIDFEEADINGLPIGTLLYTTPLQRPWVGLTDEEASWCQAPSTIQTWKRIEAKLKEKNT